VAAAATITATAVLAAKTVGLAAGRAARGAYRVSAAASEAKTQAPAACQAGKGAYRVLAVDPVTANSRFTRPPLHLAAMNPAQGARPSRWPYRSAGQHAVIQVRKQTERIAALEHAAAKPSAVASRLAVALAEGG
jgi:predicted RNA methylase